MKIKALCSLVFSGIGLLVVAGVTGCKGPEGPAGSTTVVNLEGFAPDIKCVQCHDADTDTMYYVAARVVQWENSGHATMGDFDRNAASCAGCHTTEGFIQRMNGQAVTDQLESSPPGCFACHSPHQRANFTLRDSSAATLLSNMVGVANLTLDLGKGNLCLQCHQPRSVSASNQLDPAKLAATDTLTITTSRWYGHYGVQGQMISGNGGFEFAGYTYNNSYHATSAMIQQEGCPICHMAQPLGGGTGKAGGHTMKLEYEGEGRVNSLVTGCRTSGCHSAIDSLNYRGLQTEVQANLDTLQDMLVTRGWLTTTGLVNLTGGRLKIAPAKLAGALWNFYLVEHDGSKGVHNDQYALALLRSSITELRNNP